MPEVINGRVAQLSFIAGIAAEQASGETLGQQFADYPVSVLATVGIPLGKSSPCPSTPDCQPFLEGREAGTCSLPWAQRARVTGQQNQGLATFVLPGKRLWQW